MARRCCRDRSFAELMQNSLIGHSPASTADLTKKTPYRSYDRTQFKEVVRHSAQAGTRRLDQQIAWRQFALAEGAEPDPIAGLFQ